MEKIESRRLEWIDNAKGIAIILMFLGHITETKNGIISLTIHSIIYSFHMPLFFCISGYLFNAKYLENYRKFLKKKAKTLLIPLYIMSIILIVDRFVVDYLITGYVKINYIIDPIVGLLYQGKKYYSLLWFLGCLFLANNIYYWIQRAVRKLNKLWLVNIVYGSIFVLGILMLNKYDYPWNLDLAIVAVVFMHIGSLYKKYEKKINKIINNNINILLIIVGILLPLIYYYYYGRAINYYGRVISNGFVFLIMAVLNSYNCVCISKEINSKVINYIGKNSILFYMFTYIVGRIPNIVIYNILKTNFEKLQNWGMLVAVIYTPIHLGLTACVVEIINRKFRWIKGDF